MSPKRNVHCVNRNLSVMLFIKSYAHSFQQVASCWALGETRSHMYGGTIKGRGFVSGLFLGWYGMWFSLPVRLWNETITNLAVLSKNKILNQSDFLCIHLVLFHRNQKEFNQMSRNIRMFLQRVHSSGLSTSVYYYFLVNSVVSVHQSVILYRGRGCPLFRAQALVLHCTGKAQAPAHLCSNLFNLDLIVQPPPLGHVPDMKHVWS